MSTRSESALPGPTLIQPPTSSQHDVMRRLWLLFRHDMSRVTGVLPDRDGRYRDERLESALSGELGWAAWLMTAGSHPIAFALARALDEPVRVLNSIFVVMPARRRGVGRRLAGGVMSSQPGRWRVAYQDANASAARFWPSVAADLDPSWSAERVEVPGRLDLPPDTWVDLTVPGSG